MRSIEDDAEADPLAVEQRRRMVEDQIASRGIADPAVLRALSEVPRHRFVSERLRPFAYSDRALPIGEGQTISQPYMVARACELAELRPSDRVLEVGAGSGYQAAVLGKIAASVLAIELRPALARRAAATIARLGLDNVHIVEGDGTAGHAEQVPYDAIVVAAGAPVVPAKLVDQLADGGRLVIPLGDSMLQTLTVLRRTRGGLERNSYDACIFVPLQGAGGWTESGA